MSKVTEIRALRFNQVKFNCNALESDIKWIALHQDSFFSQTFNGEQFQYSLNNYKDIKRFLETQDLDLNVNMVFSQLKSKHNVFAMRVHKTSHLIPSCYKGIPHVGYLSKDVLRWFLEPLLKPIIPFNLPFGELSF